MSWSTRSFSSGDAAAGFRLSFEGSHGFSRFSCSSATCLRCSAQPVRRPRPCGSENSANFRHRATSPLSLSAPALCALTVSVVMVCPLRETLPRHLPEAPILARIEFGAALVEKRGTRSTPNEPMPAILVLAMHFAIAQPKEIVAPLPSQRRAAARGDRATPWPAPALKGYFQKLEGSRDRASRSSNGVRRPQRGSIKSGLILW